MKLHTLSNLPGAGSRQRKRKGIGRGTGNGKTAGRGHKGQKARSGGSVRAGFESGHIPLYRKLPHRGFNNSRFAKNYAIVNVGDLARLKTDTVDRASLVKAGLIRNDGQPIKLLGDGEADRAFTVQVEKVSASARAKIEAAGGKVGDAPVEEKAPAAEDGTSSAETES